MSRTGFMKEEKAVSPVIGVILMVAITVILAAVIASFVFGLGTKAPKVAPQASLTVSEAKDSSTGDYVVIVHQGGESILWDDVQVLVSNETAVLSATFDGGSVSATWTTTGTKLIEADDNDYFEPGEKIKLVADSTAGYDFGDLGDLINVKVVHEPTGQTILSADVKLT